MLLETKTASEKREWVFAVLWPIAVLFVFLPVDNIFDYADNPFNIKPRSADYLVFWFAGTEAALGRAIELYDPAQFKAGMIKNFGAYFSIATWLYPPHILFLYAGLSKLTYGLGWLAFGILSAAGYLLSIARAFPGQTRVMLLSAISPALFICAMQGQSGILTSALLIGGLFALRDHPIRAGILIGILTIKPQLGILIPFILIFERQFLSFIIAAATTLALVAASALWLGVEVWQQYLAAMLDGSSAALLQYIGSLDVGSMMTFYGLASTLGASHQFALAIQALAAFASLIATWMVARSNADFTSRVSAYILLSYLISPYIMNYDFPAATLVATMVIAGANVGAYTRAERIFALLVFLLPFIHTATELLLLPVSAAIFAAFAFLMVRRCIQSPQTNSPAPARANFAA